MSTSPEETNTGATKLAWTADDDDFSAEDGGWDDSYDVNEDLDVSLEHKKEPDNDPDTDNSDGVIETAMDAIDEHETGTGASPTVTATPTPIPALTPPNPVPSGGRPPSSNSKIVYSKGDISSISATYSANDRATDRVPNTPNNILSTISGTATPLSLVGTPRTPLVELEDGDEEFEEIVRKRNRVSKSEPFFLSTNIIFECII